jgi:hypothetical protein
MQTTPASKRKHASRVSTMVLGYMLAGGWVTSCGSTPISNCRPDNAKDCLCKYYGDCEADGGGTGGAEGLDPPVDGGAPPRCKLWKDQGEIEEKLLVPTCGVPVPRGADPSKSPPCHSGDFVPRMDMPGMIEMNLLHPSSIDLRKRLVCKITDPWVALGDRWETSFMLKKTNPALGSGDRAVTCADGKGNGMARMPSRSDPAIPSLPLTTDEYDCVRFYVYKLAGN